MTPVKSWASRWPHWQSTTGRRRMACFKNSPDKPFLNANTSSHGGMKTLAASLRADSHQPAYLGVAGNVTGSHSHCGCRVLLRSIPICHERSQLSPAGAGVLLAGIGSIGREVVIVQLVEQGVPDCVLCEGANLDFLPCGESSAPTAPGRLPGLAQAIGRQNRSPPAGYAAFSARTINSK